MYFLPLTAAVLSVTGLVHAIPLKHEPEHGEGGALRTYGNEWNRQEADNMRGRWGNDRDYKDEKNRAHWIGYGKNDREKRDFDGLKGDFDRFGDRGRDWFHRGGLGGWGRDHWDDRRRDAMAMGPGGDGPGPRPGDGPAGYGGLGKGDEGGRGEGEGRGQVAGYGGGRDDEKDRENGDREKEDREREDHEREDRENGDDREKHDDERGDREEEDREEGDREKEDREREDREREDREDHDDEHDERPSGERYGGPE